MNPYSYPPMWVLINEYQSSPTLVEQYNTAPKKAHPYPPLIYQIHMRCLAKKVNLVFTNRNKQSCHGRLNQEGIMDGIARLSLKYHSFVQYVNTINGPIIIKEQYTPVLQ